MAYSAFGINYDTAAKLNAYGGDASVPAQPVWAEDTHQLWIVHGTQGKYRVAMASELTSYLPLSGGEMKGEISLAGTLFSRDPSVPILKNINNGAKFFLFNPDDETYKGGFIARAKWSQGRLIDLVGGGDGSLKWDNKHIIRSVNGVQAGVDGNVALPVIPGTGDAGTIKTYETVVAATTVGDDSARSMSLSSGGRVTVNNGTSGKSWITVVALSGSATISLGSSWSWSGSSPTLSKGLVTLAWYGTFGVATFTKFGS